MTRYHTPSPSVSETQRPLASRLLVLSGVMVGAAGIAHAAGVAPEFPLPSLAIGLFMGGGLVLLSVVIEIAREAGGTVAPSVPVTSSAPAVAPRPVASMRTTAAPAVADVTPINPLEVRALGRAVLEGTAPVAAPVLPTPMAAPAPAPQVVTPREPALVPIGPQPPVTPFAEQAWPLLTPAPLSTTLGMAQDLIEFTFDDFQEMSDLLKQAVMAQIHRPAPAAPEGLLQSTRVADTYHLRTDGERYDLRRLLAIGAPA